MSNRGVYFKHKALTKILDATGWKDPIHLLAANDEDDKNYGISDEVFLNILQEKGLIPSFTPSDSGDTIQNIQFNPSTSELTIITDKQTFVIAIPQFYKVDTIAERDALITSVGETALIGSQVYVANTSGDSQDPQPKTYRYDGNNTWVIVGEGSGGPVAFDGNRTVTRSGLPAINAGGSSITEWINNYFFPPEPPIALLTGGNVREFGSTLSVSVTYTATKKTYGIDGLTIIQGLNLNSINVDSNIDEDSDNKNNQQSGNYAITLQAIAEPSIQVQVSEQINFQVVDNKNNSDLDSTVFTFRHGFYYGVLDSDDNAGTNPYADLADIIANPPTDAGILSLTKELRTNFNKTLNIGGGGFTVFAFPTLFGTPSFVVNGLPNSAFTKVRNAVNFTNSLGFRQPYDVWVLNNYQNGPSTIQIS